MTARAAEPGHRASRLRGGLYSAAVLVLVDNFMNSPKYDEVVDMVVDQHKNRG